MTAHRVGLIVSLFCFTVVTRAQSPVFDVTSIRLNTLNDRIVSISPGPGGRFNARGYSLKLLIQYAWKVKGFQVKGGPGWLDEDRWDVVARGPAGATPDQLCLMVQSMLQERFGLKVHTEQRVMPGFELSVAGARHKMQVSTATEPNSSFAPDSGGAHVANGISMPVFATMLGAYLARPVEDRTGLPGIYDFRLFWNQRADAVPADDPNGVSLISAVRDQLGLRLRSAQVSAQVLVIERASKPSAN